MKTLILRQACDLSRVYPTFPLMVAGIDSSHPDKNKQKRIDGWKTLISPHLERFLIVIWYLDIDLDLDILFPLDGV